jgi:hypothetical protein
VGRIIDDELGKKLGVRDAPDEQRQKWRREAREDKQRIRKLNSEMILRYGGRSTDREKLILQGMQERRSKVLQQIAGFQDRLILHYWIILDGLLQYRGWHSINQPGYAAWEAITRNDSRAGRAARIGKLRQAKKAPGGLRARWEHRREMWKYFPDEVVEVVFDYLRTKEQVGTWDAEHIVKSSAGRVEFDVTAWDTLRNRWAATFLKDLRPELNEIQTTRQYANQVLYTQYHTVLDARDEVLLLPWSWEYYIRVEIQAEDPADVKAGWQDFPEGVNGKLIRKQAEHAPGTVKAHFDEHVQLAKQCIRLLDFASRWRKAIDTAQIPPGR